MAVMLLSGAATLLCSVQASAEVTDEPITYVPEMHPTYREEVPARRRLARGAEDPLTKAASKALGVELDFCIRLRRNMRREVMIAPEADIDFFSAGGRWGLCEMRLYGTRNRSERNGTAITYRYKGSPIYIACSQVKDFGGDQGMTMPGNLVTFAANSNGEVIRIDSKDLLSLSNWSDCFVTDMSGDGLIDVAIAWTPGVSGGGGVECFSVGADGRLRATGAIRSAYGLASLVDLNNDGLWEIETQGFLGYEGGMGSYQFNILSTYSEKLGRWAAVTDYYGRATRHQRRFYRRFTHELGKNETAKQAGITVAPHFSYWGKRYRLNKISFESADARKLLRSWDGFDPNRWWE